MKATDHDGHNRDGHKHVFWRQYDSEYAVNLAISYQYAVSFHVFIAVAIMMYLVAIMVCSHHGTDPKAQST